jgi:hypothetical protein
VSRRRVLRRGLRYDRLAAAGSAAVVTVVAVLGGVGVIPDMSVAAARHGVHQAAPERMVPVPDGYRATQDSARERQGATRPELGRERVPAAGSAADDVALPKDSGEGRRVVFSEELQRVWLVGTDGEVRRTYLVSGSLTDNLQQGTYEVWSRSEQAWGIDDTGTMRWFVRFAHGERAAIGFHDIPVDEGRPVQTVDELGTPQSHGCVRQRTRDARRMWDFAQLGTTVVVV